EGLHGARALRKGTPHEEGGRDARGRRRSRKIGDLAGGGRVEPREHHVAGPHQGKLRGASGDPRAPGAVLPRPRDAHGQARQERGRRARRVEAGERQRSEAGGEVLVARGPERDGAAVGSIARGAQGAQPGSTHRRASGQGGERRRLPSPGRASPHEPSASGPPGRSPRCSSTRRPSRAHACVSLLVSALKTLVRGSADAKSRVEAHSRSRAAHLTSSGRNGAAWRRRPLLNVHWSVSSGPPSSCGIETPWGPAWREATARARGAAKEGSRAASSPHARMAMAVESTNARPSGSLRTPPARS